MINVTKTFLPPYQNYLTILKKAWDDGWITNRGQLVEDLEKQLKEYLNVEHIIALTNGTLPLQIAIKSLNLKGEIITTPFSYVATTSSIVWEGCKPVFVDIDSNYLTIDETKIEAAITPNTSAIMATHVFGNPCAVEVIDTIAKKYNLKVIYDAAHCFDVEYKGQSIFSFGDVSTCSFHATKIFHTGEGGALFTNNEELYHKLFYHHNFGHKGNDAFYGLGINAKMSELQAAMGLAILPYIKEQRLLRERIVNNYNNALINSPLQLIKIRPETKWNFSYYPVVFESEEQLLKVMKALEFHTIFPRRYFYPSLNKLPYLTKYQEYKISESFSSRVLCLPLYTELKTSDQKLIINTVLSNL